MELSSELNRDLNIKDRFNENQKKTLVIAETWAQNFFDEAKREGSVTMGGHGFDHNQRVAGLALWLSINEGIDPFLPVLTSLIFDVGRTSKDPKSKSWMHGQLSREICKGFVDSIDFLNDSQKEIILDAIEDHPKLNKDVRENEVVKIVMDADRLDTLGAMGPIRAASTRWQLPLVLPNETETSVVDTEIKSVFQDIKYRQIMFAELLWTESARKYAEPLVKFHKLYIEVLKEQSSFVFEMYKSLGI